MQTLKLKHLVAIRWFHWINFPLLFLMIWSGFLIYWAYPIYTLGPIHFFPARLFKALNMNQRLAEGMALHFFTIWFFVANGILYVAYTLWSGEWRLPAPRSWSAFRDAWHVALHDLHFRREVPEQDKYNAAQQISYIAIVLMGIGSVVTGFAIYKPAQLSWLTASLGGYASARYIHFFLTIGYCVFFVIHVTEVAITGWNNFRSMIIGWEMVNKHE